MHVINYISPVDYMRGSLSPSQTLEYAEHDNPAWQSPDGLQPALNYSPILVAALRKSKRYYMVRAKSSVNWKASTRLNVAAFAGACALFFAVSRDLGLRERLTAIKDENAPRQTLREYVFPILRDMLESKNQSCTIAGSSDTITIHNPWQYSGTPVVSIPAAVLSKYQNVL